VRIEGEEVASAEAARARREIAKRVKSILESRKGSARLESRTGAMLTL